MATIGAPVSTEKVREALSETGNDIGRLCSSGKINMWAKCKPVQVATPKALTEEQRAAVFYGLDAQPVELQYPSGNNNASIFKNALDGAYGWSYSKPTGGAQSPYRLGDFKGYNHACSCPFWLEAVENGKTKAQVLVGCSKASELPANNLTADIIRVIAGLESPQAAGYGLLYRKNGTVVMRDAIDDAGNPLYPLVDTDGNPAHYTIDISDSIGTYEVAAYIINTQQSQYYLMPVPVVTCEVKAPESDVIIYFAESTGAYKIILFYTVEASDSALANGGVPAGTAYIRVYKNSSDKTPETIAVDIPALTSSKKSYNDSFNMDESVGTYHHATFSYKGVMVEITLRIV